MNARINWICCDNNSRGRCCSAFSHGRGGWKKRKVRVTGRCNTSYIYNCSALQLFLLRLPLLLLCFPLQVQLHGDNLVTVLDRKGVKSRPLHGFRGAGTIRWRELEIYAPPSKQSVRIEESSVAL